MLASLDGVEFAGVYDPALDGAGYGGARGHASAEALLASGLDCCVIAAPTSEHERLAAVAAENGVSVLVEKPLAHDSAAARRMQQLFDSAGLVGVVGHIERFNPATIALQVKIESGDLGDLYQLATRRQGPFPERIRDVGVVMDLATHDIDLTRWVTGSDYDSVSAWTAHKSGRHNEDLVIGTGQLGSGLVVSHHVNWLSAAKERLTAVTGEGGTMVADTLNADLYFYENAVTVTEWQAMAVFRGVGEGNMTRFALPKREPLVAELEAFRDAVRGDRAPAVPFSDGAEVVGIAELLLESARTRTTISVATS